MMTPFTLRLYAGEDFVAEVRCTALSLEREIYTPYQEVTATFVSDGRNYGAVDRIAVLWGETEIFLGLADSVTQLRRGGCILTKVRGKSFTSLLVQNELEKNLYYDITVKKLVEGYYRIPYVTHEDNPGTGYINIKDGTSLWDCIVTFGYKLNHHYPYVTGNKVCLSLPEEPVVHTVTDEQVLEFGTVRDTTRLVSHYHMEDIAGTEDAYSLENPAAAEANVVRHKFIAFDRQFLRNPSEALSFRNLFSQRGWRAKYLVYEGFGNEELGERVSFGAFLQNQTICRVLVSFGQKGLRTKVWAYEDGFYHK